MKVLKIWLSVLIASLLTTILPYGVRGQKTEADTHFDRGMDYLNKRMLNKAIAEFNKAIEIDPNSAEIY